jgi:hypothetical protein
MCCTKLYHSVRANNSREKVVPQDLVNIDLTLVQHLTKITRSESRNKQQRVNTQEALASTCPPPGIIRFDWHLRQVNSDSDAHPQWFWRLTLVKPRLRYTLYYHPSCQCRNNTPVY